ncbi:macrophage-expressed 1 protein-like, partial [Clarias magur]
MGTEYLSLLAIIAFISTADLHPVTRAGNGLRECRKNLSSPALEVLPGGGWDNLRNLDMGRVMNLSYSQCQTTEDGIYLIPDETFVIPQKVSAVEMNSEIITSWLEQKSSTSWSINADASFGTVVNGKFSAEHKRMKTHQVKDNSVTARVQVRNHVYTVKAYPDFSLDARFARQAEEIADAIENNQTRQAAYLSEKMVLDYDSGNGMLMSTIYYLSSEAAMGIHLHLFVCVSILLTLCHQSSGCRRGTENECEKAPFVPGYNLAGEGFDVVKLQRKGAYLINVKSHRLDNRTCTVCKNRFQGGQMQKLPLAIVDWRPFSRCGKQLSSALHHSIDSLIKSSASLINNNWGMDLSLEDVGKAVLGGSHSDIAKFAQSQHMMDKATFALHEMSCTYYRDNMSMGFYQGFMTQKLEVLGGESYFPDLAFPQSPANAYANWMNSLHENPDIISYAIYPLHHLVTDPELSASLRRAVTDYIEENMLPVEQNQNHDCKPAPNLDHNCCPLRAEAAMGIHLQLLVCVSILLTLCHQSSGCRSGTETECEKAPFVPGYNLAGEGFDVVKLQRKGAYLINVKSHLLDNRTCTVCKNHFQGGQMQKLPLSIVDWRPLSSCNKQFSSALHHSIDSLIKSSASLMNNDWGVDLNLDNLGKAVLGGSDSNIAKFAQSQHKMDKMTFALHEVTCTYY